MSSSTSPQTKRLSQKVPGSNYANLNSPVSNPSAKSSLPTTLFASSASHSPSPLQARSSSPNSGPESISDEYLDYRRNTLRNEVQYTFPVATRSAEKLQPDRHEIKHAAINPYSERASFSSTFSSFTPYSTKSRQRLTVRTCASSDQVARISTDNVSMRTHAYLHLSSMSFYLTCNYLLLLQLGSIDLVPPIPRPNIALSTKQLPRYTPHPFNPSAPIQSVSHSVLQVMKLLLAIIFSYLIRSYPPRFSRSDCLCSVKIWQCSLT